MTAGHANLLSGFIMAAPLRLQPQAPGHGLLQPPPQPRPPLPVMSWPALVVPPCPCPVVVYPVIAVPTPPFTVNSPSHGTIPQSVGMPRLPLVEAETNTESNDERPSLSNEKGTQIQEPDVDEDCVPTPKPQNDDNLVDEKDDVEKISRHCSTDCSKKEALQNHVERDQENQSKGIRECDHDPTTTDSEEPLRPGDSCLIPNLRYPEDNDSKSLSAGEGIKKLKAASAKRVITVDGQTYFVSRGMEEKFGFTRTNMRRYVPMAIEHYTLFFLYLLLLLILSSCGQLNTVERIIIMLITATTCNVTANFSLFCVAVNDM